MEIRTLIEGKPSSEEHHIFGWSTVMLLQNEERNVLYDCGNRMHSVLLRKALEACGLGVSDITDVVISHLHFDHVGNLPMFSNARVFLSRAEWESAENTPDEYHDLSALAYLKARGNIFFTEEGGEPVQGCRVISLPGHTPGLIGLLCAEDTLLVSDAVKNRQELEAGIGSLCWNAAESRESISRIKRLAKVLYPGHDGRIDL